MPGTTVVNTKNPERNKVLPHQEQLPAFIAFGVIQALRLSLSPLVLMPVSRSVYYCVHFAGQGPAAQKGDLYKITQRFKSRSSEPTFLFPGLHPASSDEYIFKAFQLQLQ